MTIPIQSSIFVKAALNLQLAEKVTKLNPIRSTRAVIVFHNSDQTSVIGQVLRTDKDSIVLQLSEGVPLQQIMAEQRFLLNKYGTLRRPAEKK